MDISYQLARKAIAVIALLLLTNYSFAAQWEYLVKTYALTGNDTKLSGTMTKLGKQGWELVNCTVEDASLTCFFKRPVEKQQ